ncbi:hypothetical protein KL86DPRO_10861 [uncultured delta proteobacterium]|uniref:Uncharacterized protein n=1 Tax=uncultured delta proteobacterium TaxID=34034 RepID=A0A212J7I8_9DELT|nr:hypothetical protein KL86DPRO_10861 [uncultured delta proteobacterium]
MILELIAVDFRQKGGVVDHDELPGLAVARARRGHARREQCLDILCRDGFGGIHPYASAYVNGGDNVQGSLPMYHRTSRIYCGRYTKYKI